MPLTPVYEDGTSVYLNRQHTEKESLTYFLATSHFQVRKQLENVNCTVREVIQQQEKQTKKARKEIASVALEATLIWGHRIVKVSEILTLSLPLTPGDIFFSLCIKCIK